MKKYIISALAVVAATTAQAQTSTAVGAGELKISGFVDFRLSSYTIKDLAGAASTNPESGFGLEDGALYLNYTSGPLSLLIDVPWRRSKNADINVATAPNASNGPNFLLGAEKAQAYGRYKVNDHFTAQGGQFDTPFGVEVNDSKDRVFGKTGLVYDNFLPVVHSGFLAEATWEGFTFKALSANPNNKGSLGTSTSGDENFEYAALVSWSNTWARAQAGYLTRPINKADGTRDGLRNLVDVSAGATFSGLTVDVEFSQLTDDNKNVLTSGDTSDKEDPAVGVLALVTYPISESFTVGVRYETIDKAVFSDTTFAAVKKADSYGASLHYAVSPSLELRTEYIGYQFKSFTDTSSSAERFSVASLFKF